MTEEYINDLFEKFRANEVAEEDLTPEEYQALIQLYDKRIREQKASNLNRRRAVEAFVDDRSTETITKTIKSKLRENVEFTKGDYLNKYYLKPNGSGRGLDLYSGTDYLATYCSYIDCLYDLSYHYTLVDFEMLINMFSLNGMNVERPYRYRGVCSVYFYPTDRVFRYVYYADALQQLLGKFEEHEKQALTHEEYFEFGVQGIGIHLYDEQLLKYKMWVGGKDIRSVADVIRIAHEKHLFVPSEMMNEFTEMKNVDVFISHKSDDFPIAKRVFDYLVSKGISAFLSEMSLPALSGADYSAEIDDALEHAKNIVVIASSKENVNSGWVKYEWNTFANEKRSGRKTGNIVTLIADNMQISDLPILLRQYEVLLYTEYEKIVEFVKC